MILTPPHQNQRRLRRSVARPPNIKRKMSNIQRRSRMEHRQSPDRHAHRVAWIADFLAVNDGASGVSELSGFTGGSVDGGCAHEKADLLRRLFALALTIQINSGNFAAGFAEWNRDSRSGLARPAQLSLVFFRVKLRFRNNLQLFADRIRISVVPFDSLHPCLPARIDPGANRVGALLPAG